MDLWVVAAAAGAGYIAKNLQNLPGDRKESLTPASYKHSFNVQSESRNFLQQFRDKTCPLRRLARKRAQDDDFLDVENHSDVSFSEIDPISSRNIEASDDYNMGWGSSVSSAVSAEEKSLEFEDGENRIFSRTNRGKFIRNRRNRMNSLRPVQSFGSFLDSQLFGEHENIEDSSSFPSMSTIRPVLVTDGSQMISKLVESVEEIQKKPEKCTGKLQLSGSSDGAAGRSFHSQGPETMLLFITGMMVGILSATTAWKNEAEKLNSQLEQMQNLVQDLYEELDMKEMVMVKELSDEPPGENDTPQDSIVSPTDVKVKKLAEFDSLKANDRNTENLELLSKIEAELEAELEMLENNYKASALERISGVVEQLDPDFEPDIIQRDLKSTMDNGMSESGDETTDTTTHGSPPANYTVSPWELSLRLHELIESRLQMRIKELETALCNSQNRVQILGSQSIVSGRRFSYCTTESSSVQQSPTEEHDKQYGPSAENQEKETNGILLRVREKDQESQDGEYSSNAGKHSIDRLMPQIAYQDTSTSFMSDEDCLSEDNETDESEMLLIKQILERRKSGSSCNLKID